MEPVTPVADAQIADAALDSAVDGRDIDGVAAAGAAGAVSGDPVRIDFGACLHKSDGIANVFGLPFGHDPAAIVTFTVTPAAVIEAQAGVAGSAQLVEHHNVVLGIFEPEKSGALDNAGKRFALIRIRQIEHARELDAFTVEIYLLCTHFILLRQAVEKGSFASLRSIA